MAPDRVMTIRPHLSARMSGVTACTRVNVRARLTAITRSQASGVKSVTEANVSTPALVTTMVIGPYASRTAWTAAATAPRSET